MMPLYVHEEVIHNLVAPREVVPLLMSLLKPKSVLDVGCGIGTWLKVFEENGVSDYIGVDGTYVDQAMLKIPTTNFVGHDLRKEWSLGRRFDLVVSLEVAEHLPEESAENFVKALTTHSDTIVFSAAVPGQGGQNHLNEQWPGYWQKLFEKHGFYFHDCLRPLIWKNENVNWWYRQNMFLVSKTISNQHILEAIHPASLNYKIHELQKDKLVVTNGDIGIKQALRILFRTLLKRITK